MAKPIFLTVNKCIMSAGYNITQPTDTFQYCYLYRQGKKYHQDLELQDEQKCIYHSERICWNIILFWLTVQMSVQVIVPTVTSTNKPHRLEVAKLISKTRDWVCNTSYYVMIWWYCDGKRTRTFSKDTASVFVSEGWGKSRKTQPGRPDWLRFAPST